MDLLGDYVDIVIEKKLIKNIYFRINDEGKIYVTTPIFTSKIEIINLLNKNKKALERMYKKYLISKEKREKVLYLGEELDFIEYKKIMIDGNIIYGPSIQKVNEYLEKNSLKYYEERLKIYINDFPNIPSFRLRVRKMKTRWGVNNFRSKTITLNTMLIHYDINCIDYVIIHELSHFYHKDHSKKFWNCVEEHYKDYKKARKELRY